MVCTKGLMVSKTLQLWNSLKWKPPKACLTCPLRTNTIHTWAFQWCDKCGSALLQVPQVSIQTGWTQQNTAWIHAGSAKFLTTTLVVRRRYISNLYLSTLSRASALGGGIMKQAPGRVLVFPALVCSTQFLWSMLDLRLSISPRLTLSWGSWENRRNLNIEPVFVFFSFCFNIVMIKTSEALPLDPPSHTVTAPRLPCWAAAGAALTVRRWCPASWGQPGAARSSAPQARPPGTQSNISVKKATLCY